MNRRNLVRNALLLMLLVPILLFVDLFQNGFTTGAACGLGFGKRQVTVQEKTIRSFFIEKLPDLILVNSVTCSGFTDSTLVATFHISTGEAKQLVAELEATFLSSEQYTEGGVNIEKRRRQIGSPTDSTHVYELSGFPRFDTRTVSVTIPRDDEKISTVVFEGGNF